jgi:hypothetical protein
MNWSVLQMDWFVLQMDWFVLQMSQSVLQMATEYHRLMLQAVVVVLVAELAVRRQQCRLDHIGHRIHSV